jgi:preprotein translocase subunit SecA
LLNVIKKVFGDPVEKELKSLQIIVNEINELEIKLQELSDLELQKKTAEFKAKLESQEATLDELLPEAFAVVKNTCRRLVGKKFKIFGQDEEWQMIPRDVQIIGGIALHQGKIAEMKTGEGKTLVSTLPIYLNALAGKGVHVVTVNDYLARRDREWMQPVYDFLGLETGVITPGLAHADRKIAYGADITYGTNNEFGFDFLRDSMAASKERLVQRSLSFAIVDEVDSILIDEARTPLIISQPAEESTQKYQAYSSYINKLEENVHYNVDEKQKTAVLSEEGIKKMEELMGVKNIFTDKGFNEVRHIEQALRAKACFKKDTDYVVKDGEVIIVDEFTGRLMPGRRYSEGLHQAIEAKEDVEIKRESRTLATITFQNYFRIYDKLAGMTGTALTESEEFAKIYGLEVLPIPTFRPIAREDKRDLIFKNERGKFAAIAKTVKEKNEKGQPVLIGTISIEKSEALSDFLKRLGVNHAVLNAKHHEKEAQIVADAGQKGAVTIATNMAGRGTDIKLGAGVADLGGLAIIGSERHESRRIDNQLRGRSGRQGDPGESQFYVSLEDPLMRIFATGMMEKMMTRTNIPEDTPIESKLVTNALESAQRKVEGRNFDIRKHLVEFDDVTNKHREIINKKRRQVLENAAVHDEVIKMVTNIARDITLKHTADKVEHWDYQEIFETVQAIHKKEEQFSLETIQGLEDQEAIITKITDFLVASIEAKRDSLPDPERFEEIERYVILKTIDSLWPDHLDAMSHLKEVVSLRGYAQKDPLMEYKQEGYIRFENLLAEIDNGVVNMLFKLRIKTEEMPQSEPSVAWSQDVVTNEGQLESSQRQAFKQPQANARVKAKSSKIVNNAKVGRNDPCPCGSGKKYKKCCGVNG